MTVARLRAEMADVLARLGHEGPLYLTHRGKPRAVLLDIDEYRVLIEQLEHLDDSLEAVLARERRERGEDVASACRRAPRSPRRCSRKASEEEGPLTARMPAYRVEVQRSGEA